MPRESVPQHECRQRFRPGEHFVGDRCRQRMAFQGHPRGDWPTGTRPSTWRHPAAPRYPGPPANTLLAPWVSRHVRKASTSPNPSSALSARAAASAIWMIISGPGSAPIRLPSARRSCHHGRPRCTACSRHRIPRRYSLVLPATPARWHSKSRSRSGAFARASSRVNGRRRSTSRVIAAPICWMSFSTRSRRGGRLA